MLKPTALLAALLMASATFSASAREDQTDLLNHISVTAIAGTPAMLERAIAEQAAKHNAAAWKITSMRIDNNASATAVLYK